MTIKKIFMSLFAISTWSSLLFAQGGQNGADGPPPELASNTIDRLERIVADASDRTPLEEILGALSSLSQMNSAPAALALRRLLELPRHAEIRGSERVILQYLGDMNQPEAVLAIRDWLRIHANDTRSDRRQAADYCFYGLRRMANSENIETQALARAVLSVYGPCNLLSNAAQTRHH